jgi:GTP-binding protein YchF
MGIKAGLVGLPNVGKSTLFNALTKAGVPAENYPFCTIDPHVAITEVPDERLDQLALAYKSIKKLPATISFVDIAGLVKGAASGEGLGNQFLSHIREVDLILFVLRCFEDPNVTNTQEKIDPLDDFSIISAELMLKDLESVEKRLEKIPSLKKAAHNDPKKVIPLEKEERLLKDVRAALDNQDAIKVRTLITSSDTPTVPLLSSKKFLVIANVSERELENDEYKNNPAYQELLKTFGHDTVIPVSAKFEYELTQLSPEEAKEVEAIFGSKPCGLTRIIQETYHHLGLITFFTCGPKEAHAWPIRSGITIRAASGEIHSDLERGFICAEIINCKDIIALGSEIKAKEAGKLKTEGQEYLVNDGDVVHVRFNV